ncbi:MAG: hypothetical protein OXG06_03605 [Gammaproteobacteria bacterium]|nr:hypothetical protein [Gammaproteobacteria bacterium]
MNGLLALLTIILVLIALVAIAWALGPVFDWLWSHSASGRRAPALPGSANKDESTRW